MDTKQLKLKILDLAIKGKLCPQNASDEPASELIKRIREEKSKLVKEKKIKASKTDSYIYRKEDGSFYERIGKTETCIDDEIPFEIPNSWVWVKGDSVFDPMESEKPCGLTFQYVDIDAINNITNCIEDVKQVATKNAPSRASRKLELGNTLFSKVRPYLRNIAFVTGDYSNCIASTGFYVIKPKMLGLDSKYCFYMVLSSYVVNGLNSNMKGDNSPSINDGHVLKFMYPLPPLDEQQRITTTIEELFSYVDEIESNQQKVQQNIAAARTKLLDLAIQGKLVPQNPDDEPASKLLERIQAEKQSLIKAGKIKPSKVDSIIYQKEDGSYYERIGKTEKCIDSEIPFPIPSNWAWARLGSLMSKICSGSTPKGGSSNYKSEGVKFIRSQNVYNDGLRLSNVAYIDEAIHHAKSNSKVIAEDLLLNITGASIGRCALVPEEFDMANINQHVLILRLIDKEIKSFIHTVVASHFVFNQIMGLQKGGTKEGLSAENAAKLLLPLAPVEEQKQIVEKVQSFSRVLESVR